MCKRCLRKLIIAPSVSYFIIYSLQELHHGGEALLSLSFDSLSTSIGQIRELSGIVAQFGFLLASRCWKGLICTDTMQCRVILWQGIDVWRWADWKSEWKRRPISSISRFWSNRVTFEKCRSRRLHQQASGHYWAPLQQVEEFSSRNLPPREIFWRANSPPWLHTHCLRELRHSDWRKHYWTIRVFLVLPLFNACRVFTVGWRSNSHLCPTRTFFNPEQKCNA